MTTEQNCLNQTIKNISRYNINMTSLIFRMKSSGWSNKGQYLTLTSKLTNKIQYKLTHYFVSCKFIQTLKYYWTYLSWMDIMQRLTNHVSEYWYIGSMLGKSAIEKNKIEECLAIGRYPIRLVSIFCSVSSAIQREKESKMIADECY